MRSRPNLVSGEALHASMGADDGGGGDGAAAREWLRADAERRPDGRQDEGRRDEDGEDGQEARQDDGHQARQDEGQDDGQERRQDGQDGQEVAGHPWGRAPGLPGARPERYPTGRSWPRTSRPSRLRVGSTQPSWPRRRGHAAATGRPTAPPRGRAAGDPPTPPNVSSDRRW